jgi:hypothetical protein
MLAVHVFSLPERRSGEEEELVFSQWFGAMSEAEEGAWETQLASEGFRQAWQVLGLGDVGFTVDASVEKEREGAAERRRGGGWLFQGGSAGGGGKEGPTLAPAVRGAGLRVEDVPESEFSAMRASLPLVGGGGGDGRGDASAAGRLVAHAHATLDTDRALALHHALTPAPDPHRFDAPVIPDYFEMADHAVGCVVAGGLGDTVLIFGTAQSGIDPISTLTTLTRIVRILDATCDGLIGAAKLRDPSFRSKCAVSLDEALAGGIVLHDDLENILRLAKLKDPAQN